MKTSETLRRAAEASENPREDTLIPRVDVHEDPEGITLYADLPGVAP